MTNSFNSNVDLKMLLIRFSPVTLYFIMVLFFESFIITLPILAPCILSLAQLARAKYRLTDTGHLIVTFGFSKSTIDIQNITSIVFKNSVSFGEWFHTYANSTNGLLVSYDGNKEIIISPNAKEEFLTEIEKSNKEFKHAGLRF